MCTRHTIIQSTQSLRAHNDGEQTPSEQTPSEQTPSEQTPSEQTPSEQTPSEQTPSEQKSKRPQSKRPISAPTRPIFKIVFVGRCWAKSTRDGEQGWRRSVGLSSL